MKLSISNDIITEFISHNMGLKISFTKMPDFLNKFCEFIKSNNETFEFGEIKGVWNENYITLTNNDMRDNKSNFSQYAVISLNSEQVPQFIIRLNKYYQQCQEIEIDYDTDFFVCAECAEYIVVENSTKDFCKCTNSKNVFTLTVYPDKSVSNQVKKSIEAYKKDNKQMSNANNKKC